jgi:hypothetical protein
LFCHYKGAYGQVYAAKLFDQEVAVKLMPVPKSIHDRCVLHDIFTEILILDKWKADERICKLIDYGVDDVRFSSLLQLTCPPIFSISHFLFLTVYPSLPLCLVANCYLLFCYRIIIGLL